MADGAKTTQKSPPQPPEKSPEEQAEEPTSGPERHGLLGWRERARGHLHVSPHAVAGALADAEPGQRFTLKQMEERVAKFLTREVPVGNPDEGEDE